MFSGLFQSGIPDLANVTALPSMDMGALGSQGPIANMTANFHMPQQTDWMGMLGGLGGLGDMGQQPQAPMMPPPQGQRLQAGGEQFNPFYTAMQYQPRQTAQALSGLLGGIYGTV